MNASRTLRLARPTEAEPLWKQLAAALPKLTRLFSQRLHTNGTTALPPVRGPSNVVDGKCRRFECSEHGVTSHSDLITVTSDGQAHRSVVLGVTIRSVSSGGLSLLELWTASVSIDHIDLKCNDDAVEDVTTLIRAAVLS